MKLREVLLGMLPVLFAASANASGCDMTKSCQIDPSDGDIECPNAKMAIREDENGPVCEVAVNDSIPVELECVPSAGGMICEGWSQEVSTPKQYLTYSWSVRVGHQTTQYQTGTLPYLNFSCSNLQSVTVTMSVNNGSFTGTTTQGYTCGDDVQ